MSSNLEGALAALIVLVALFALSRSPRFVRWWNGEHSKHLADTPSVETCPRRRTSPTFQKGWPCSGQVLAWEFERWHRRATWADDMVPCPEHSPERYARRLFSGAAHKGERKWWKR